MANFHRDTEIPHFSTLPSPKDTLNTISSSPSARVPQIVIVGSGMSGLVTAMFLARKGFQIDVFEKREGPSSGAPESGRSMNLTLCERGLSSLKELGIRNHILSKSVRLSGRAIHHGSGKVSLHNYGESSKDVLHAIRRYDLSAVLIDEALHYPNIRIHYSKVCISLDKQNKSVRFFDRTNNAEVVKNYDLLVGADGVFSEVRGLMQEKEIADFAQRFSGWGYKELSIYASQLTTSNLIQSDRLHVWARKNALLIGIPNNDQSFTCNLFMPLKGQNSFETIKTSAQVQDYFQSQFPHLVSLVPNLQSQYLSNRANSMVSIQTSLWHYKDSIVLVGDASHGIYPFLGQGVNSAFEDCSTLNECLAIEPKTWKDALEKYEGLRKPNAEALTALVDEHFLNLQSNVTSTFFSMQTIGHSFLSFLTFRTFKSVYSLISHTTVPYIQILKKSKLRSTYAAILVTVGISTFSILLLISIFHFGRTL